MTEPLHGYTCTCCAPRGRGRQPVDGGDRVNTGASVEQGTFDGKDARIERGQTGRVDRVDIYYGGSGWDPKGPGHGHVVSNDGVFINFWRLPDSEGGAIVLNDDYGKNKRVSEYVPLWS
ncbi:hypothetical protein [Streptomyces sp. SM11]|uniref:hypothetical protein n=1 Tax=Streptomyces sp. SM11 TaxID=565557 RepID=UPI000CD5A028|nr:hypothetical protein [Streptomyces sp. SM11]